MAKSDVKKISRIKVKKKLWYPILAPRVFGLKEIGESHLAVPESAVGRVMKISLKELTGNVKDQNVYVSFKITGMQGNKLSTSVIGYSLTAAHIKRVVKKNTDRIDNYFILKTKNHQDVVIKTLMVTVHKTKRSIRSALSHKLQELLREEFSKLDFNSLTNNIVYQKIQQPLKKLLSKTYPIRELAVKSMILKGVSEKSLEENIPEKQGAANEDAEIAKDTNNSAEDAADETEILRA